jgi:hypothetical protein
MRMVSRHRRVAPARSATCYFLHCSLSPQPIDSLEQRHLFVPANSRRNFINFINTGFCRSYAILFLLVALLSQGATTAFCGMNAGTGITGSKHDLNMFATMGTADPQGRICFYCHVPHHAEGDTLAPGALWDETKNKYFKPYQSQTFDSVIVDPLIGPTKICLSCHDGKIASDAHPGLKSDDFGKTGVGINADLSNDHPVGLDYQAVFTTNKGYKTPDAKWQDGNGRVTIRSVLYDGKYLTCATCHDMHNGNNVADTNNTYNYFVYSRQSKSSLCLSCHDK